MFIYKCHICKKEIQDGKISVRAEKRFTSSGEFCEKCGKPVLQFLKKNDLLKE